MSAELFDYAIIGAGAAGLQLALAMESDAYFSEKSILILDKDGKTANDKTWCFWEIGQGKWDGLISKSWETGLFHGKDQSEVLNLSPYKYKMLRSEDFYAHAKNRLLQAANIQWVQEEITEVQRGEKVTLSTQKATYKAAIVFDSRVPEEWSTDPNSLRIYQHFRGWRIKTVKNVFDPESFTMMDYRLGFEDSCCFTYILPISSKEALIEFTFFTPDMRGSDHYDELLKKYIAQVLKVESYQKLEVEEGVIPMTNYPFEKHQSDKLIKIGAAAGWVKASTGYSFNNAGKKVDHLIQAIKSKSQLNENSAQRFKLYDSTLLHVLQNHNSKGPQLFTDLYTKNPIQRLFRFLDEESSPLDELAVMASVDKAAFGKAFLKELFR